MSRIQSPGSRLLVLAAALAATGCPGPSPSPGVQVQIGSLSVQPAVVHARPDVRFQLRALPRSKDNGFLISEVLVHPETGLEVDNTDKVEVTWHVQPGSPVDVKGKLPLRHRATVEVPGPDAFNAVNTSGKDTLHYDIIAEANGEVGRARVVVILDTVGVAEDIVETDDPGEQLPAMILIDADDAPPTSSIDVSQCAVQDQLRAVAGRGILGDLYSGTCNRAILLQTTAPAQRDDHALWSAGAHRLDMRLNTPFGGGAQPVDIPVALWLVTTTGGDYEPPDAAAWAATDVSVAQSIFAENRSGITFKKVREGPLPNTTLNGKLLSYLDYTSYSFPCDDLQDLMLTWSDNGASSVPEFDQYVIHLFYLPGTRVANVHGEWCEPIDGKRGAVIIYWPERLPSVLAHELGHVLGLQHYCDTSAGCVIADSLVAKDGKDAANVLAEGPDLLMPGINDWSGASRSWLTIGQVFRMNWYKLSFMSEAREAPYTDADPRVLPEDETLTCYGQERCPPEQTGAIP